MLRSRNTNNNNNKLGFPISTELTIKHFELIKVNDNKTYKVEHKETHKLHSIVPIKKKQMTYTRFSNNRRILVDIKHPFVISLNYAFQTNSKLYLVTDHYDGSTLSHHVHQSGNFPLHIARFYAAELFLAIEFLHQNDIFLADLSSENIIIDHDGHIKLTDLYCSLQSMVHNKLILHTFNDANPEYLSPQIIGCYLSLLINGYIHAFEHKYVHVIPDDVTCIIMEYYDANKPVIVYKEMDDWWSFGCIMYEMLCGITPFYDKNIKTLRKLILYSSISFNKFMDDESIHLMSCLLHKNPQKRINSDNIKSHPFFRSINWTKLYNKEIKPPFVPKETEKNANALINSNHIKIKNNEDFFNDVIIGAPCNSLPILS